MKIKNFWWVGFPLVLIGGIMMLPTLMDIVMTVVVWFSKFLDLFFAFVVEKPRTSAFIGSFLIFIFLSPLLLLGHCMLDYWFKR